MSDSKNVCVSCAQMIKMCHRLISCKYCKLYVHKKCTKLKQKELKKIKFDDWVCKKCKIINESNNVETAIDDTDKLLNENVDVLDIDLEKYD